MVGLFAGQIQAVLALSTGASSALLTSVVVVRHRIAEADGSALTHRQRMRHRAACRGKSRAWRGLLGHPGLEARHGAGEARLPMTINAVGRSRMAALSQDTPSLLELKAYSPQPERQPRRMLVRWCRTAWRLELQTGPWKVGAGVRRVLPPCPGTAESWAEVQPTEPEAQVVQIWHGLGRRT